MKRISLIPIGNSLMHIKQRLLFSIFLLSLLCSAPLKAFERGSLLSLGVGIYNVCRNQRTMQYQAEYKWALSYKGIQPFFSFFITNQQSFYFCAGACYDICIADKVIITPSFGPGIYSKGKGKDLHFPLEFRSSLALSYQFSNKCRLGAQFYHISNASLGKKNPGAESLIFFIGFPTKY